MYSFIMHIKNTYNKNRRLKPFNRCTASITKNCPGDKSQMFATKFMLETFHLLNYSNL